jgi:hypothetical protein
MIYRLMQTMIFSIWLNGLKNHSGNFSPSPLLLMKLHCRSGILPWRSVSQAVSMSRCGHFLKGEVQQWGGD